MKAITFRPAQREDCAEIIRLIQELADFEKMPDGPKIDQKDCLGFEMHSLQLQCSQLESELNRFL